MRIITIDYIDVIASGRERMVKEKKGEKSGWKRADTEPSGGGGGGG